MSLYQLQLCVYNYLRTLEGVEPGSPVPTLSTSGYDLNEEEERALKTGDVGAMYSMGIHPVIIVPLDQQSRWPRSAGRGKARGS